MITPHDPNTERDTMRVAYMGLERIEARYTHQLEDWNREEFEKDSSLEFIPVYGTMPPAVEGQIVTGSVLDAHGRTHWSMTQMANLVGMLQRNELDEHDVIFFEDMFTPGIESLAYIFDQTPPSKRPRVYVRCLAQTIDPDDFVHRTGMFKWMRRFEQMVASFVDGIICASQEMVAHLHIAGLQDVPIFVTGLPFGKAEVLRRFGGAELLPAFDDRDRAVAFAARFDDEKQPGFFMDVIEEVRALDPSIKFRILTGMKTLKSNSPSNMMRLRKVGGVRPRNVEIYEGLTKEQYYGHLSMCRVLFNCALQDWVSNTVSEADTLGTQTLYPAYRSFPEVFANDPSHMYLPWSVKDAAHKLIALVNRKHQKLGLVSDYQNESIGRTISVLKHGRDSAYMVTGGTTLHQKTEYRELVSQPNFEITR